MTTTIEVPMSVTPAAAARITELRMQPEFDLMLQHTQRTVSGLQAIEVTLESDSEEEGAHGIVIWSMRTPPGPGDDPTDRQWGEWKVRTLPANVCQHFVMLSNYGAVHGR